MKILKVIKKTKNEIYRLGERAETTPEEYCKIAEARILEV